MGTEQYDEFDLGSRVPPRQPSDSEKNAANVTDGQGIAEQNLERTTKGPSEVGAYQGIPYGASAVFPKTKSGSTRLRVCTTTHYKDQ
jgi:hypothetical protein